MDYSPLSARKLAQECILTNEPEAWLEFNRRYKPVIVGTVHNRARRWSDRSQDICQDLVQEVYLKLVEDGCRVLQLMVDTTPEEKYHAYLKVVALNRVEDYFKGQGAKKRGAGQAARTVSDVE